MRILYMGRQERLTFPEGATFAARAAAFEKRICACFCDGLVTDVDAAWLAVMPAVVRNAPTGLFDWLFKSFEKVSPQLAGFANHYRFVFNVNEPHEIFETWKPYNVNRLAPMIDCPLLLIYGEAELAQSGEAVGLGVIRWMRELKAPLTIRAFGYDEGWAATHCQVGAISSMQALVFDWLEVAVDDPARLPAVDPGSIVDLAKAHWRGSEIREEMDKLVVRARSPRSASVSSGPEV